MHEKLNKVHRNLKYVHLIGYRGYTKTSIFFTIFHKNGQIIRMSGDHPRPNFDRLPPLTSPGLRSSYGSFNCLYPWSPFSSYFCQWFLSFFACLIFQHQKSYQPVLSNFWQCLLQPIQPHLQLKFNKCVLSVNIVVMNTSCAMYN